TTASPSAPALGRFAARAFLSITRSRGTARRSPTAGPRTPASTRRLSGRHESRRAWRTRSLGPRRSRRSRRGLLGGRGRRRAGRRRVRLILGALLRADADDLHLAAIRRVERRIEEQLPVCVVDLAFVARLEGRRSLLLDHGLPDEERRIRNLLDRRRAADDERGRLAY